MDRKDNTGMRSRPQQVSVPPPAFQVPEPQSLSEGTAVQVSEDDDCRSNSEYFALRLDSNISRYSASSRGDDETSSHLSSIFTSDLSICEDDLEHDGETQTSSVVSSTSSHLSSISTDFLSSISSNPCSRPSSESCSLASLSETDSVSDNMLFADYKPPQWTPNTPQQIPITPCRIPITPQRTPSLIASKLSELREDFNVSPGFNVSSGFNVSLGANVPSGSLGTECKYPEYADEQSRLDSFKHWPAHLTQTSHQMANAGFFYTSFSDWVRCFCCGIGVRNWAAEDDPWVEHARWSPRCAYVRLMRNPQFLDDVERAVQEREQEQEIINQPNVPLAIPSRVAEDVSDVKPSNPKTAEEYPEKTLEKNPLLTDAAQAVLNMGFLPKQVKRAIDVVLQTKTWQTMTAEDIVDVLTEIEQDSADSDSSNSQEPETGNGCLTGDMERLKERNEDLRERTLCKMCCIEKVSIVFLPCGHLVSCGQCSPALRKCPMCRKEIKGTVRVKFD
ncbi:death-associated inhibitor of apoptosis 2-like isoform X2 [Saccostrea echinata]|uniref:death-associated inhibitor of apoptosis 2-like isoform X2 n=1 Tax=Saccostrea echinata TaxID=191078 RepID=UPI002A83B3AF|nr:death-associated inhibitor of apoptosis 2-like isoform X2 [Saccostrea echinata]